MSIYTEIRHHLEALAACRKLSHLRPAPLNVVNDMLTPNEPRR
jgi:hypothetical protein